ncbi:Rhombotin-1 [Fukomys damarensis]|uniref:Rhombotin-1 n=1 Tax=Fukomys damarensis TaxID=885580 RepID=A0A091CNQ1_FUKDA|nr:Rhombotin-1 [Fukomys damarensis]
MALLVRGCQPALQALQPVVLGLLGLYEYGSLAGARDHREEARPAACPGSFGDTSCGEAVPDALGRPHLKMKGEEKKSRSSASAWGTERAEKGWEWEGYRGWKPTPALERAESSGEDGARRKDAGPCWKAGEVEEGVPMLSVQPKGKQKGCAGCNRKIKDRYLLKALDKYWHEDCLKCACCDCRLGEVGSTLYTKANLILCRRDYLRASPASGPTLPESTHFRVPSLPCNPRYLRSRLRQGLAFDFLDSGPSMAQAIYDISKAGGGCKAGALAETQHLHLALWQAAGWWQPCGERRPIALINRLFGTTGNCAACSKLIPAFEMVMRARDNVYHLDCFACQLCNQRFCVGDKFFLKNNMILCQMDYEEGQLNGTFETQVQ